MPPILPDFSKRKCHKVNKYQAVWLVGRTLQDWHIFFKVDKRQRNSSRSLRSLTNTNKGRTRTL